MSVWRLVMLYVLMLGLAIFGLLFIDPNYFDLPLGRAETGLQAPQAPPAPFTTAVLFDAETGAAVEISLAAKDAGLGVTIEVLSPAGDVISTGKAALPGPQGAEKRNAWSSFFAPAPTTGKYTLRLTQDAPGRITVYFFQGPFLVRIIGLPFAIALLLFLIYRLGPARRAVPAPVAAPPVERV